jgi:glucosylceramidase
VLCVLSPLNNPLLVFVNEKNGKIEFIFALSKYFDLCNYKLICMKNRVHSMYADFNLKYISMSVCSAIFSLTACSSGSAATDVPTSPISIDSVKDVTLYTTSTSGYSLTKSTTDLSSKSNMAPNTVTMDTTKTYQTMDGFGVAITGSTSFNLMQMSQADRTKFLTETFSPTNGYGFSYVRVPIGCSDFSLSDYTCCDTKGIENFALQREEKDYVIPVLKEIVAINPSIKILASPWTCPPWMKVEDLTTKQPHNSYKGGRLNPDYYQDYATYFVKWIQAFEKEGINIYSITPQNEPRYAYNSAALYMEWWEERDFVKNALFPHLKDAGLNVRIYAWDHNYDGYDYPLQVLGSDAADCFVGSAFHDYAGSQDAMNMVHQEFPNKGILFTESSIGTWNSGRNLDVRLLSDMENLMFGNIKNWCTGVIVWNLMLDYDRGPNRGDEGGCSTCYGAVDINYDYKTITRNSHYYVIAQTSAVVKPGAVRIGTKGYESDDIEYQAFRNVDGTYAFIIINKTSGVKSIVVSDGTKNFTCILPAKSIVSTSWK